MRLLLKTSYQQLSLDANTTCLLAGRSPACDLVITADCVSRQHLRFEYKSNSFYAIDESQNGSYLYSQDGTYKYFRHERIEIPKDTTFISLGQPLNDCSPDEFISFQFSEHLQEIRNFTQPNSLEANENVENTVVFTDHPNQDTQTNYSQVCQLALLNYLLSEQERFVAVLDENLHICYHSDGWIKVMKKTFKSYLGKDILMSVHKDERQIFFDKANQCLLQGETGTLTLRLNTEQLEWAECQVHIVPNGRIGLDINGLTIFISLKGTVGERTHYLGSRYELSDMLSGSNFANTFLAYDHGRPGSPQCIVKQLRLHSYDPKTSSVARRLFYHEALTLEKLGRHDQIPLLLGYLERNGEFYLIQDFIKGDSLHSILQNEHWDEHQIYNFLLQMLQVLVYVHSQQVIHRDIKPENIIRRSFDHKYVLIDFGAVKLLPNSLMLAVNQQTSAPSTRSLTIPVGTPGYMALEQKLGHPQPASDIYSLGVIAVEALARERFEKIQRNWTNLVPCSSKLKKILAQMVAEKVENRYQSAEVVIQDLTR